MAESADRPITITHGRDYQHLLQFATSTAGHTYSAMIRAHAQLVGTPDAAFTVIVLSDLQVMLSLTATQTAALIVGRSYSWDVKDTVDGLKLPLIGGIVTIEQDVTH